MANPNQTHQGGARARPEKTRVLSEGSPGEARTPDRRIGQVVHADDHADDKARNTEIPRAFPDRDPAKKKTGEF